MMLTATERMSHKNGAEDGPGGEADGSGDTWEVTAMDADAAGVGGRHGAENRYRAGAV